MLSNFVFLFQAALGGHMLGIADEDGWVQILDSRKTGRRSIIKGMWNLSLITKFVTDLY